MLPEQTIESEMRGSGPPIILVQLLLIPKTGYFHGTTKISKSPLRVIYNLLLKIL